MSESNPGIWHVRGLMDVNRILDVSPVGHHERDEAGMSEEERKARRRERMRRHPLYSSFDPIDIDIIGGPVWAFRRKQSRSDMIAKAAMNLGGKPAVTPKCREVLEQADLGEVDFFQIEVLDVPRGAGDLSRALCAPCPQCQTIAGY